MERERERREIYYEELDHTVMEAEKPHKLPSASWRSRKAGGTIQSNPKAWELGKPMA